MVFLRTNNKILGILSDQWLIVILVWKTLFLAVA